MMRTTAEASSTILEGEANAISAFAILADQVLWAEKECCFGGPIGQSLAATLASIAAKGLLEITEGLLTQAPAIWSGLNGAVAASG